MGRVCGLEVCVCVGEGGACGAGRAPSETDLAIPHGSARSNLTACAHRGQTSANEDDDEAGVKMAAEAEAEAEAGEEEEEEGRDERWPLAATTNDADASPAVDCTATHASSTVADSSRVKGVVPLRPSSAKKSLNAAKTCVAQRLPIAHSSLTI